jgi:hypothetical protein
MDNQKKWVGLIFPGFEVGKTKGMGVYIKTKMFLKYRKKNPKTNPMK